MQSNINVAKIKNYMQNVIVHHKQGIPNQTNLHFYVRVKI